MTVLNLNPPHTGLRLVATNGQSASRATRLRTSTPLYGDARALYQQVLQAALARGGTLDPDALRVVLAAKQATTATPMQAWTSSGIWQLMFVDIVSWCRNRRLDVPPTCARALAATVTYLDQSNTLHETSDDIHELLDAIDECTGGWVDMPSPTPAKPSRSLRSSRGTKRT